jgi:GNAT superfamily N-acetyltransferase
MTYDPIPAGELAAVVTYLEMHEPPAAEIPASPLSLRPIEEPDPEHYRRLFRLIGSPWLWFSRLIMDDEKLAEIIQDPRVELHAVVDDAGDEIGMLELDLREAGQCELAFIGLIPELSGKGHGRWLLAEAVRRAWREGVRRVHVHLAGILPRDCAPQIPLIGG